ncbi:uncharacterized protein SOCEGT47_007300 [Sorangium cellulosum]|uniref:Uncharacterized protein n=1 Tax=Sorangium cellulosum TaxID=56 RepID=A0A4P2PUE9_SORCE|nr:uncharacterized protein SOCEGT47_007300 [Sorangium cellulosum]
MWQVGRAAALRREPPATTGPLPPRAERGAWEGRTARRPEGPSTGRGWAAFFWLSCCAVRQRALHGARSAAHRPPWRRRRRSSLRGS